jgi:hypothetical protein
MSRSKQKAMSLEQQLGVLAMQFRGTRDEPERTRITEEYASVVEQLIATGFCHARPLAKKKTCRNVSDWRPRDAVNKVKVRNGPGVVLCVFSLPVVRAGDESKPIDGTLLAGEYACRLS